MGTGKAGAGSPYQWKSKTRNVQPSIRAFHLFLLTFLSFQKFGSIAASTRICKGWNRDRGYISLPYHKQRRKKEKKRKERIVGKKYLVLFWGGVGFRLVS